MEPKKFFIEKCLNKKNSGIAYKIPIYSTLKKINKLSISGEKN